MDNATFAVATRKERDEWNEYFLKKFDTTVKVKTYIAKDYNLLGK